jgi:hypothetical protein
MVSSYLERFQLKPAFPTELHRAATEAVVDHLSPDQRIEAILLANSCARGKAVAQSCVDIAVLVAPGDWHSLAIEDRPRLNAFLESDRACVALRAAVPWGGVELDFITGEFEPGEHGWTTGPDYYEVEIGNALAWTHPLLLRGQRFETLRDRYLPYYDEGQRQARLQMVIHYAANNLEHIAPYAGRGLYDQAFKRLYHAFEEYLQALFIQRRIYPIAYDKWLQEQLVEILHEPALYEELLAIVALASFTQRRLGDRARRLGALLKQLAF